MSKQPRSKAAAELSFYLYGTMLDRHEETRQHILNEVMEYLADVEEEIEAEALAWMEKIQGLQPHALGYILKNGFTFDVVGPLADDASELDRWKVLAFSLYTDLCEAESEARAYIEQKEAQS